MWSFKLSSIFSLINLLSIFCLIQSKSLESKIDRMNFPSILREKNKNDQLNNQPILTANQMDIRVSSNAGSDEIINILRGSLAKLPGQAMGKLIDKRNTFLNVSQVEELLELETNSIDVKDEPGCFIEIKIVKRIPGRCAMLNGEPVCKADNYYKRNNECLKF